MLTEIDAGPVLEAVLDGTFPVWNDGLSRKAYSQWNLAQLKTRWGKANLQRVGLVDGDTVLASAKRYLFDAIVAGEVVRILGIGAVFTPDAHRGRGLAARLIDAMLADGRERGCRWALLFSEIGPDYYARLGFTAVERADVTLTVPRSRRGAPATLVRALDPADLPELAAISQRNVESADGRLVRSADLLEFGIVRQRLRAGLGPDGLRQVEAFVSEEGHKPVSYVVVTRGPEGVRLVDCGDRDPTGARVGAMLEVLAERDPASEDRTLVGWLPPGMRPPQLAYGDLVPTSDVMMWKPLLPDLPACPVASVPDLHWRPIDVF
jgi:GNAT superfamily N-acetyltransferase